KWSGNYDYVVNWQNDGKEIRNFTGSNGKVRSRPQNANYYFREAITWSDITSGEFAVRFIEQGFIPETAGMSAFYKQENLYYLLLLLNSKIANYIFKVLNPT